MPFKLIFTKEARQDIADAYSYYETLLSGLGEVLLDILDTNYLLLSENPYLFSFIDSNNILRDVKIDRFPYVIIYEITADTVIVYALHNTYKKR